MIEKSKGLLPKFKKLQKEQGFISEDDFKNLSNEFGITVGEAYSSATFYSFLSTKPLGKNIIRICKDLPCELKDYRGVLDAIKNKLGIDIGETTKDKKFSLALTNCIGACDAAPAMMINEKIYGNLTPQKVRQIIDSHA